MKAFILFLSMFATTTSYAFFCPNNFKSIDLGNSIEQVIATCGSPTSQNTYKKSISSSQEWDYFKSPPGFMQGSQQLTVVFQNDIVVNLRVPATQIVCSNVQPGMGPRNCSRVSVPGQQSVGSTLICGGIVRLNDTSQTVRNACGEPVSVKELGTVDSNTVTQVTELRYDASQSVSLIFENGALVDRKFN